jgi:excisionase family DNA binding protein
LLSCQTFSGNLAAGGVNLVEPAFEGAGNDLPDTNLEGLVSKRFEDLNTTDLMIAAETWSKDRLPELLGRLEQIRATAQARLFSSPAATAPVTSIDANDILTVKQAAAYAQVSCSVLYRVADDVPCVKIGNAIRFRRSTLDRWMAGKKAAPGSP